MNHNRRQRRGHVALAAENWPHEEGIKGFQTGGMIRLGTTCPQDFANREGNS